MQSTAALKEYVDTAIKDILYEEEDQIATLRDRVCATEELLGIAFAGFSRMATILNYIRNSGGSARINVLELCEMLEAELRQSVIEPVNQDALNGNTVPYRVRDLVNDYRNSIMPTPMPTEMVHDEFTSEESAALRDLLRDE